MDAFPNGSGGMGIGENGNPSDSRSTSGGWALAHGFNQGEERTGVRRFSGHLGMSVLGPVRIGEVSQIGQRQAGARTIGAPMPRALLALLIIKKNSVVPMWQIVEELWREPPQSAVNIVRQYICKLRTMLNSFVPSSQIGTYSGGYDMTVDPGVLDSTIFEERISTGQGLLVVGRVDEAIQTLGEAVDLYRGPAYFDVERGAAVLIERVRLDELFVDALVTRARAQINVGELVGAIAALRWVVGHHPFREHPYMDLMKAFALDGRKADALAVYRRVRTLMIEELGLDVSQQMRDMERHVLLDELR